MSTYKVFKVSRKTGNKRTLKKGLSLEAAQAFVKRPEYSNTSRTMVCYTLEKGAKS